MKSQQVNLMAELLDFISREFSFYFKFEKKIQTFFFLELIGGHHPKN